MNADTNFQNLISSSQTPGAFLHHLFVTGWLKEVLPEVHRLYGVPQRADHHPEVDTGRHIELCLDQAAFFGANPSVRVAVLLHDLGKALTPVTLLPKHYEHEKTGVPVVQQVCNRLRLSPRTTRLALAVCEYHIQAHSIFTNRSKTVNAFIKKLGFEKDHEFLIDFVMACRCDATGRLGKQTSKYTQGDFLIGATLALKKLPMVEDVPNASKQSHDIYEKRLDAIRFMRKVHDTRLGVK